jgi:hypothetical protein
MAATVITGLPVHQHQVREPGSAGAMPFRKFVAACGQQRNRDMTVFVKPVVACFQFLHFLTRHMSSLEE